MRGGPSSRPRSFPIPAARPLVLVSVVFALLAANSPNAFGHAAFLDSTPEPGQRLEGSAPEITLSFTEPLIRALSKATLVNATSGKQVAAKIDVAGPRKEIVLRPSGSLGTAPYRVEWRTVSPVDGHALEGGFGFGVRTVAVGGAQQIEQSPLARGGWLRIAVRWLLYASLLFFTGGMLNALLLGRGGDGAAWLAPESLRATLRRIGADPDAMAARAWALTVDAGWLAAGSAVAVALIETADAVGGLTLRGINDFLLSNDAGVARVSTVVAVSLAALAADRSRAAAAGLSALAFLTISFSGHANSADPRAAAVLTDWTHLLAAAVWVGGIAQIAVVWLPVVRSAGAELRREVMRQVLRRFGRVALPAFLVVAATGLTNALIQLGRVEALWETSYGRVLALKIALVALIGLASYWHALKIRPRLMAANPHPSERLERRHWRLLSTEPLLAVGVAAVAAALVAFPLPPRQLGETGEEAAEARARAACDPCPLPKPRPHELAVAEQAGSRIAAFSLRRAGDRVSGTLRLLDSDGGPVDAPVRVSQARPESCGLGCWRFTIPSANGLVSVAVEEKGRVYRASVPVRWRQAGSGRARRLVEVVQATMRTLESLQERERLTSGPGTSVRTLYRFKAPNRFSYRTSSGAESIVIGRRQWTRTAGDPWRKGEFGGLKAARTRDFFRWTPYAQTARLLGVRRQNGRRVAEVALMDRATPVWFRLTIDLGNGRVLNDRMVTRAHFMARRYLAFNERIAITPPARAVPAG